MEQQEAQVTRPKNVNRSDLVPKNHHQYSFISRFKVNIKKYLELELEICNAVNGGYYMLLSFKKGVEVTGITTNYYYQLLVRKVLQLL